MFVEVGYTLRVRTDDGERRLDLAHRNLRKYGTVYNTMAAVCDVHGTIEAVPRGGYRSAPSRRLYPGGLTASRAAASRSQLASLRNCFSRASTSASRR